MITTIFWMSTAFNCYLLGIESAEWRHWKRLTFNERMCNTSFAIFLFLFGSIVVLIAYIFAIVRFIKRNWKKLIN